MKYNTIMSGILVALLVVGATGIASAVPLSPNAAAMAFATPRATYEGCIVNFNLGVLKAEVTANPAASVQLASSLASLTADGSAIATVNAGASAPSDVTIQSDLVNARTAFLNAHSTGAMGALAATFHTQVTSLEAARDSCEAAALSSYGQAYVNLVNAYIAKYQAQDQVLASQQDSFTMSPLNTSGMDSVLASATAQVATPLASAVASAGDNATLLRQAVSSYCLFDGCSAQGSINFHLEAKYSIAYLAARELQLTPLATQYGVSLTTFNTDLAAASTQLAAIGTAPYAQGQSQALFGQISVAQKDLQDVRNQVSVDRRAGMVVQEKISAYTTLLNSLTAKYTAMENGSNMMMTMDYSGILAVLSNANTQIVVPLQAAEASNTTSALQAAANEYCLTDGCKANGSVNFHLDAQLELAILTARGQAISTVAANYSIDMTAFNTALSTASTELASIGTTAYGPGQADLMSTDLKAASQALAQVTIQAMKDKYPNGAPGVGGYRRRGGAGNGTQGMPPAAPTTTQSS